MESNIYKKTEIKNEDDLIKCRIEAGNFATEIGFDEIDRVRITTAVSEIVRNAIIYAGKGKMELFWDNNKILTIVITDNGPGINDIPLAMKKGYSTIGSLGMGLPGARQLMGELNIISIKGEGTQIIMKKILHER